jgi:putative ABC transport system permease protein
MFRNFILLTFRSLFRHKFSSFINIFGLAVGFASFICILLYVYDDSQYDRFHEQERQIFRVQSNTFNQERLMTNLPALFYEPLKENLPEAIEIVRIMPGFKNTLVRFDEKAFYENEIIFADPAFFDVFSFELERGHLEGWRQSANQVLITPGIVEKYFGEEDPLGKTLQMFGGRHYQVAGILKEIPERSHLQFSMVMNFESMRHINSFVFESWGNFSSNYYLLLREDADPRIVQEKMLDIFSSSYNRDFREQGASMQLTRLRDVYLDSTKVDSHLPSQVGNRQSSRIFAFFAILILLLACFNYVNLATAKSTIRAREVGMRKVMGAPRSQLIRFFMTESFLVCLISMVIGIGLAELLMPLFSEISGKHLALSLIPALYLVLGLSGLLLLVSVISGIYPAMVMSGFNPVHVLKGSTALIGRQLKSQLGLNLRVRQIFIVLQFAISIGLVAGSAVFYHQTRHSMKNTGFEKEFLVVIRNNMGQDRTANYHAMKAELEQYPQIVSIGGGMHVPTEWIGNQGYLREVQLSREFQQPIAFATADYGYFETLGATMAEGRTFDLNVFSDSTQAVVLNQSAVNLLGLTDPVNATLTGFWDGHDKQVIGVVNDIHFQSMHRQVQPTAFFIAYNFNGYAPATSNMLVRFNSRNIIDVVDILNRVWKNNMPAVPPDFFFVDVTYENLYRRELQVAGVTRLFTVLAVVIACMGLLGTTSYIMEARKKEFGVRKVLGASVFRLTRMISLEFSLLVLISTVIAWPLAYYFLSGWLDTFVYRIELTHWYFILAGIAGWMLAMFTVNFLAYNHARKNPLDSIRYE